MTSELKSDLRYFGYKDGHYISECKTCGCQFLGAKRSWACKPCAEKKAIEPKVTRAVPDVAEFDVNQSTTKGVECHKPQSVALKHDVTELVRYDKEFESMFEREDGKYVLHSQAAEIIAAKDKEINRLSQSSNQADQSLVDKYRDPQSGLFNFPTDVAKIVRRLEAAEAKLAQYEAQEPFGYVVERNSLSVDFQYEPLTPEDIESGIKATPVYTALKAEDN